MSPEKEKELRDSLNSVLADLREQKTTMDKVVAKIGMGKPFEVSYFSEIWKAIKVLENMESIPSNSLLFAKKLVEIEYIFKNSSTLKNHNVPKFREIIPIETLTYAEIDKKIDILENKSKNLLDRGHTDASKSVKYIVDSLRELNILFFEDQAISYEKYKERSIDLIRNESFGLDQHRGCKEILMNLLLLISTLGVAHIAKFMGHGYFLFTPSTDTSNKIDNLEKVINNSSIHFPSTSK